MKPLTITKIQWWTLRNEYNSRKFQKIFDNILKLQNEEYEIINRGVN